jgi:hypothetical protein
LREEILAQKFGSGFKQLGSVLLGRIAETLEQAAGHQALSQQLFLDILHTLTSVLAELAHGIVELARQDWFGGFRILGDLGGAVHEIRETLLLTAQAVHKVLPVR